MSHSKFPIRTGVYVSCALLLISSIYLTRYTQQSILRQKICKKGRIETDVEIVRRPLEKKGSFLYEDAQFRYIFSQSFHPSIGEQFDVIGTIVDTVQCQNIDKITLKIQRFIRVKNQRDSVSVLPIKLFVLLEKFQTSSESSLSRYLNPQELSIFYGVLLGKKIDSASETGVLFLTAGLVHILVASGTNVALFAGLTHALMRKIFSRNLSNYLALISVFAYAVFIGLQPPILRAVIMYVLVIVAESSGRPKAGLVTLLWTVSIMLIYRPFLIYSLSFQLTVAATLGMLLAPPAEGNNKIRSYIESTFATSFIIFLFTTPLLIASTGTVNLITIFSSISVLWIVPILTVIGFPLILLSVLVPSLVVLFLSIPTVILMKIFVGLINIFSTFPYAVVEVSQPTTIGLVCYYGVLALYHFFSSSREKQSLLR